MWIAAEELFHGGIADGLSGVVPVFSHDHELGADGTAACGHGAAEALHASHGGADLAAADVRDLPAALACHHSLTTSLDREWPRDACSAWNSPSVRS
ncbi:MAG TPA: hypothetical protein VKJ01_12775, partial [Candidatus Solibacter sp.]|nr:hypothetical protein [Candidatus Solibacter sp.]